MNSVEPITGRQSGELCRLLEERGVGRKDFQLLIQQPDRVIELLRKSINPYQNERVKQAYFYPEGWTVSSFETQVEHLTEHFPGIELSHVEELAGGLVVPEGFDGIAVFPKLSALGRVWNINEPYGKDYGVIVEAVLGLIGSSRPFHNYRKGELTERYIRLEARVREKLAQVEGETEDAVNVMPISFGNLYAGYSARNARETALRANQLPLGSAQNGCLLLVMPDRLTNYNHLFIDCPADEYNWLADGRWSRCPCFCFRDGELGFFAPEAHFASVSYGSAVGFPGV